MVGPDDKAERPNGDDRPHHHAIAEDVAAGMGADEIRDEAKRRQRHDIDFRMAKEPEQMLEENGAAAAIFELFTHLDNRRHKEACSQKAVQQHHEGADEQGREGQQRHHRRGENAPDAQGHAHQRHAPRAPLQYRNNVIQPAHREANDEQHQ